MGGEPGRDPARVPRDGIGEADRGPRRGIRGGTAAGLNAFRALVQTAFMPAASRQDGPRPNPHDPATLAPAIARAARNEAGLGILLAGTLALAGYLAAGSLPLAPWGRGLLALIPFAWIAGKQALSSHVRALLPGFEPRPTPLEQTIHRVTTIVVTVSCLGVLVFAVERLWGRSPPWQVYASLAFTVAMPVLVWRFLKTTEELILGVFLMFQAVLLLAGRPAHVGSLIQIPIVAALAMLLGARQHHEFLALCRAAGIRSDHG